jgi:hypothetical protein
MSVQDLLLRFTSNLQYDGSIRGRYFRVDIGYCDLGVIHIMRLLTSVIDSTMPTSFMRSRIL